MLPVPSETQPISMSALPRNLDSECRICGSAIGQVEVFVKNGCPIVRCLACGVGRTLTDCDFVPADIYTTSYFEGGQSDGYADYSNSEDVARAEFRKLLKQMGRLFPLCGRLVEVGSAYGYFLAEAAKYFEAQGLELSKDAVRQARLKGLNVIEGEATNES